MAAGAARPLHDHRDPPGLALDACQVGPAGEIAEFDVAAGGKVVEGHVDRIEMVDQGLARMPVIDEQAVEPLLL